MVQMVQKFEYSNKYCQTFAMINMAFSKQNRRAFIIFNNSVISKQGN